MRPRTVVRIHDHGGPDVLAFEEMPRTTPGPGEVEARVTHVALNHLDVWVRRGVSGHDFGLPRIPGSDVAVEVDGAAWVLHPSWGCGTCAACLDGTQDRCRAFRIRGENVDGGCATYLNVPRWQLLPVPSHLTPAQAVALPLTTLTAWHMLVTRAGLRRGERVLVQAGGSGVGVMAIQIARMFGCEVHATASTPARRARLETLGAVAWPYDAIGVRNVDVVVESVGTDTWDASMRALAWGGRLVTCGATSGARVGLDLRPVFFKQLSVLGATMGSNAEMLAAWREVTAGRLHPVVDGVVPMGHIREAHERLEARDVFGKIVLAWEET